MGSGAVPRKESPCLRKACEASVQTNLRLSGWLCAIGIPLPTVRRPDRHWPAPCNL
jgi:hypothetical protein